MSCDVLLPQLRSGVNVMAKFRDSATALGDIMTSQSSAILQLRSGGICS